MWMCVCLDSLPVVGLILCRRLTGSHGEELFNQFAPKHSFCSLSSLCCPLPSRLQRAWLEPGRWQQLIPCCPAAVLWTDPRNHSESPIPGISHSSYSACQSCLGKEVLRGSEELQVEIWMLKQKEAKFIFSSFLWFTAARLWKTVIFWTCHQQNGAQQ